MASVKRDRRRTDIAKYLEAYKGFGAPQGNAAEQAVWVILARHGTKEGANRALSALWRRYVDVNELRVAKATEIASLIGPHIKNDAIRVAEQLRGFLRRWHKDQHTADFGHAENTTPDQSKKYLLAVEEYGREIALALFMHFCAHEIAAANEEANPADGSKPKKRGEKDITASANRMRLYSAFSAHGKVTAKSMLVNSAKALAKTWAYAPLPAPPKPKKKAAAKPVPSKPAPTKPAASKPAAKKAAKKVTKKPAAKKAAKKATTKKGGGTARPKTTRAARTRRSAKKSSRR